MQKYSTKTIVINLSSTVTNFPVEVEGQIITHISGDVLVNIRLDHRTEDQIPLEPRDSIIFPEGITFQRFFVSGSAGGGTVILLVAKPNIRVDKGQIYVAGNVSIGRDKSWHYMSDQSKAFMANLTISAANYALWVLHNPSGSGILAKVQRLFFSLQSAATVDIGWITGVTGYTAGIYGENLYIGGSNSLSRFYYDDNAALEINSNNIFDRHYRQATTPYELDFGKNGVVIPEGEGLAVECETIGSALIVSAQWIEE